MMAVLPLSKWRSLLFQRKNKPFGFAVVGNLQHEVGYLKDLVSRNAEQADMKTGL